MLDSPPLAGGSQFPLSLTTTSERGCFGKVELDFFGNVLHRKNSFRLVGWLADGTKGVGSGSGGMGKIERATAQTAVALSSTE